MAATLFHNVTGSSGVDVELLAPGDGVNNIQSITITNTHESSDAIVSLKLYSDTTAKTFVILGKTSLPNGATLLLDNASHLNFDNSNSGFGLYANVASGDTVDILINT